MVTARLGTREGLGPRILIAYDLSASAEQAVELILRTAWPSSTILRVVTSPAGIGPPLSSFAGLREVRAHAHEVRGTIAREHQRLRSALGKVGLAVETKAMGGRPERAIVAEADRFQADLIVVGARGQGAITATLLGSVSRAVVEDARCSVLVVRGTSMQRVLLATDGSGPARFATSMVASWPAFAEARVLLVAVGEPAPRYPQAVLGTEAWRAAFRDTIASSTDQACDLIEETMGDLDAIGREVDVEIRLGDVASEVAAAARDWSADLVTVGSNGRSLLQRLFADSVPRKVLDSVDASVLVARPPNAWAAPARTD